MCQHRIKLTFNEAWVCIECKKSHGEREYTVILEELSEQISYLACDDGKNHALTKWDRMTGGQDRSLGF